MSNISLTKDHRSIVVKFGLIVTHALWIEVRKKLLDAI